MKAWKLSTLTHEQYCQLGEEEQAVFNEFKEKTNDFDSSLLDNKKYEPMIELDTSLYEEFMEDLAYTDKSSSKSAPVPKKKEAPKTTPQQEKTPKKKEVPKATPKKVVPTPKKIVTPKTANTGTTSPFKSAKFTADQISKLEDELQAEYEDFKTNSNNFDASTYKALKESDDLLFDLMEAMIGKPREKPISATPKKTVEQPKQKPDTEKETTPSKPLPKTKTKNTTSDAPIRYTKGLTLSEVTAFGQPYEINHKCHRVGVVLEYDIAVKGAGSKDLIKFSKGDLLEFDKAVNDSGGKYRHFNTIKRENIDATCLLFKTNPKLQSKVITLPSKIDWTQNVSLDVLNLLGNITEVHHKCNRLGIILDKSVQIETIHGAVTGQKGDLIEFWEAPIAKSFHQYNTIRKVFVKEKCTAKKLIDSTTGKVIISKNKSTVKRSKSSTTQTRTPKAKETPGLFDWIEGMVYAWKDARENRKISRILHRKSDGAMIVEFKVYDPLLVKLVILTKLYFLDIDTTQLTELDKRESAAVKKMRDNQYRLIASSNTKDISNRKLPININTLYAANNQASCAKASIEMYECGKGEGCTVDEKKARLTQIKRCGDIRENKLLRAYDKATHKAAKKLQKESSSKLTYADAIQQVKNTAITALED